MNKRKGKNLETQAKKFLMDHFNTDSVFKLINTERMDFIVIDRDGCINLVEAKQTKSKYYNPKSSPVKRAQLERYFNILNEIKILPNQTNSKFYILARLRGKIVFESYESMDAIPTRIE